MANMVISLIFLGLLVITFFLIFLLFREIQNQRNPQSRSSRTFSNLSNDSQFPVVSSPALTVSSVPKKIQKKFYRMLGGNQETATRLLEHLRQKHPNKPEIWYWEKAISDLERDRT
jgi:uncharacterized short protein YbdD (DUF466 family)